MFLVLQYSFKNKTNTQPPKKVLGLVQMLQTGSQKCLGPTIQVDSIEGILCWYKYRCSLKIWLSLCCPLGIKRFKTTGQRYHAKRDENYSYIKFLQYWAVDFCRVSTIIIKDSGATAVMSWRYINKTELYWMDCVYCIRNMPHWGLSLNDYEIML